MRLLIIKFKTLYNLIYPTCIFCFFLFYLVVSPINRIFPFSLNRLAVFVFLILFLLRVLTKQLRNLFVYLVFGFLLFVLIYTSVLTRKEVFKENLEDYIYFSMTILCFLLLLDFDLLSRLKRLFQINKLIIVVFVAFVIAMFSISFLFKSSFETDGAFRGFTVISHAVATVSILCIVMLLAAKIKLPIWYLPFIVFIFLSKARTFLILLVPLMLVYCLLVFNKKIIGISVFVFACVCGAIIIPFSPIGQKIAEASSRWYRNHPIDAISNTRSIMWTDCLSAYLSKGFLNIIFGNGFSFVRDTISSDLTARLWAHNDVIEILCSTGIFGLFIYLSIFIKGIFYKSTYSKILLIILFGISALLNGFMLYFPLPLSCVVVACMLTESSEKILYQKKRIHCEVSI